MIGGLALLLLFQLLGEITTEALDLAVPGPVIGMIFLFIALLVRGSAPEALDDAAQGLLKHLALLFVPAGVGVVTYLGLIQQEWLPITVALIGSTAIAIGATALTMQALARSLPRDLEQPRTSADG